MTPPTRTTPPWQRTTPPRQLPPNWKQLRKQILQRDNHQCTWTDNNKRCTQPATDIDHIQPNNNHHPTNLRALCQWHHNKRTAQQGNNAKQTQPPTKRPTPKHPGTT